MSAFSPLPDTRTQHPPPPPHSTPSSAFRPANPAHVNSAGLSLSAAKTGQNTTANGLVRPGKQPVYNPYDKFSADDFDTWINGITGALKQALGQEEPTPSAPPPLRFDDDKSRRHRATADIGHAPNGAVNGHTGVGAVSVDAEKEAYLRHRAEVYAATRAQPSENATLEADDDGVVEDSFAEIMARKARGKKGKARDPREGPGLGPGANRNQPIELLSSDEEDDDEDAKEVEMTIAVDSDEEEEEEESGDIFGSEEEGPEGAEEGSGVEEEEYEEEDEEEEEEQWPGEPSTSQNVGRSPVRGRHSGQEEDGEEEYDEEYDEEEEDEEEEEMVSIRRPALRAPPAEPEVIEILSDDDEEEQQPRVQNVHHEEEFDEEGEEEEYEEEHPVHSRGGLQPHFADDEGDEEHYASEGEDEDAELAFPQHLERADDSVFVPSRASPEGGDDEGDEELQLPDVWSGPRTYAEDFYSGGDQYVGHQGQPMDLNQIGSEDEEYEAEGDEDHAEEDRRSLGGFIHHGQYEPQEQEAEDLEDDDDIQIVEPEVAHEGRVEDVVEDDEIEHEEDAPPPELADNWRQATMYADDFYTGGDVIVDTAPESRHHEHQTNPHYILGSGSEQDVPGDVPSLFVPETSTGSVRQDTAFYHQPHSVFSTFTTSTQPGVSAFGPPPSAFPASTLPPLPPSSAASSLPAPEAVSASVSASSNLSGVSGASMETNGFSAGSVGVFSEGEEERVRKQRDDDMDAFLTPGVMTPNDGVEEDVEELPAVGGPQVGKEEEEEENEGDSEGSIQPPGPTGRVEEVHLELDVEEFETEIGEPAEKEKEDGLHEEPEESVPATSAGPQKRPEPEVIDVDLLDDEEEPEEPSQNKPVEPEVGQAEPQEPEPQPESQLLELPAQDSVPPPNTAATQPSTDASLNQDDINEILKFAKTLPDPYADDDLYYTSSLSERMAGVPVLGPGGRRPRPVPVNRARPEPWDSSTHYAIGDRESDEDEMGYMDDGVDDNDVENAELDEVDEDEEIDQLASSTPFGAGSPVAFGVTEEGLDEEQQDVEADGHGDEVPPVVTLEEPQPILGGGEEEREEEEAEKDNHVAEVDELDEVEELPAPSAEEPLTTPAEDVDLRAAALPVDEEPKEDVVHVPAPEEEDTSVSIVTLVDDEDEIMEEGPAHIPEVARVELEEEDILIIHEPPAPAQEEAAELQGDLEVREISLDPTSAVEVQEAEEVIEPVDSEMPLEREEVAQEQEAEKVTVEDVDEVQVRVDEKPLEDVEVPGPPEEAKEETIGLESVDDEAVHVPEVADDEKFSSIQPLALPLDHALEDTHLPTPPSEEEQNVVKKHNVEIEEVVEEEEGPKATFQSTGSPMQPEPLELEAQEVEAERQDVEAESPAAPTEEQPQVEEIQAEAQVQDAEQPLPHNVDLVTEPTEVSRAPSVSAPAMDYTVSEPVTELDEAMGMTDDDADGELDIDIEVLSGRSTSPLGERPIVEEDTDGTAAGDVLASDKETLLLPPTPPQAEDDQLVIPESAEPEREEVTEDTTHEAQEIKKDVDTAPPPRDLELLEDLLPSLEGQANQADKTSTDDDILEYIDEPSVPSPAGPKSTEQPLAADPYPASLSTPSTAVEMAYLDQDVLVDHNVSKDIVVNDDAPLEELDPNFGTGAPVVVPEETKEAVPAERTPPAPEAIMHAEDPFKLMGTESSVAPGEAKDDPGLVGVEASPSVSPPDTIPQAEQLPKLEPAGAIPSIQVDSPVQEEPSKGIQVPAKASSEGPKSEEEETRPGHQSKKRKRTTSTKAKGKRTKSPFKKSLTADDVPISNETIVVKPRGGHKRSSLSTLAYDKDSETAAVASSSNTTAYRLLAPGSSRASSSTPSDKSAPSPTVDKPFTPVPPPTLPHAASSQPFIHAHGAAKKRAAKAMLAQGATQRGTNKRKGATVAAAATVTPAVSPVKTSKKAAELPPAPAPTHVPVRAPTPPPAAAPVQPSSKPPSSANLPPPAPPTSLGTTAPPSTPTSTPHVVKDTSTFATPTTTITTPTPQITTPRTTELAGAASMPNISSSPPKPITASPSLSVIRSSANASSSRHAPISSSPVTRSHCRYHRISIPKEEGGPRIFFLVPGCSLNNQELITEEEIEDHGEASYQDTPGMLNDIQTLDLDAYVISVLRHLVGPDIMREDEVYYLPLPGEVMGRRPPKRKERAPSTRQPPQQAEASARASPPVSIAGSTSTSRSVVRKLLDLENGSTVSSASASEWEESDPEDEDESPTKRTKTSHATEAEGASGAPSGSMGPPRPVDSKKKYRKIKAADKAYAPPPDDPNQLSDDEPGPKRKARRKSTASTVSAVTASTAASSSKRGVKRARNEKTAAAPTEETPAEPKPKRARKSTKSTPAQPPTVSAEPPAPSPSPLPKAASPVHEPALRATSPVPAPQSQPQPYVRTETVEPEQQHEQREEEPESLSPEHLDAVPSTAEVTMPPMVPFPGHQSTPSFAPTSHIQPSEIQPMAVLVNPDDGHEAGAPVTANLNTQPPLSIPQTSLSTNPYHATTLGFRSLQSTSNQLHAPSSSMATQSYPYNPYYSMAYAQQTGPANYSGPFQSWPGPPVTSTHTWSSPYPTVYYPLVYHSPADGISPSTYPASSTSPQETSHPTGTEEHVSPQDVFGDSHGS